MNEDCLVRSWVGESTGKTKVDVQRIPGDASTRHYYRVKAGTTSLIAMKMEPFADLGERLPFLQVQRHLSSLNLPVPKVHDVDPIKGLILLSDLGDETLLKRLEGVSQKRDQLIWFKQAIQLLVELHSRATKTKAAIDAYGLYFDESKLMWEVQFTLTHFYNGVLAPELDEKVKQTISGHFTAICRKLASRPWYFTHRDFHSRNIMVKDDDLFLIDFQDARMGCAQYDLASLLRDSYYQLDEDLIYELVEYYHGLMVKRAGFSESLDETIEVFDLMSIQRNFKAIGSFASFLNKRGDARYIKFIGNTFENVRRNLLKFSELDELRRLLFRYYYF